MRYLVEKQVYAYAHHKVATSCWLQIWLFTNIRAPNIVPQVVGLPYNEDPNKVLLMSEPPPICTA